MNEKFYLMSFLLMDIHVKQMQGMSLSQLDAHIKDAMDLVDRVYEAGKERKWVLSFEQQDEEMQKHLDYRRTHPDPVKLYITEQAASSGFRD